MAMEVERRRTHVLELAMMQSHKHQLNELLLHIEVAEYITTISATGIASNRIMLGEILAWLGCACRASSKELEIECWVPSVLEEDNGSVCSLHFAAKTMKEPPQADSACWRQIFKNPTIAKGYPIPHREGNEQHGLEIPLKMAAVLGYAQFATEFAGQYLLKGPCSALVAVAQSTLSTVWHYVVNTNLERMTYQQPLAEAKSLSKGVANPDCFRTSRHFVGWSSKMEVRAGMYPIILS